jgi:hypothetical protein
MKLSSRGYQANEPDGNCKDDISSFIVISFLNAVSNL